ncbi:Tyrosine-protein kinase receptor Tie-2 [Aphis craccivora]|uniref:Tyrosine-protein kinase receptor Tie-2 n=1 Tax=Aphis craccivora TaxID=307492 RepID=A0A6G0YCL7_APHCR|nr:Tyrosine-protein kinase receptor Tie-2 [Aphis craccivora]
MINVPSKSSINSHRSDRKHNPPDLYGTGKIAFEHILHCDKKNIIIFFFILQKRILVSYLSGISDRYCNDVQIFRREDMPYKKIYLRVYITINYNISNGFIVMVIDKTLNKTKLIISELKRCALVINKIKTLQNIVYFIEIKAKSQENYIGSSTTSVVSNFNDEYNSFPILSYHSYQISIYEVHSVGCKKVQFTYVLTPNKHSLFTNAKLHSLHNDENNELHYYEVYLNSQNDELSISSEIHHSRTTTLNFIFKNNKLQLLSVFNRRFKRLKIYIFFPNQFAINAFIFRAARLLEWIVKKTSTNKLYDQEPKLVRLQSLIERFLQFSLKL